MSTSPSVTYSFMLSASLCRFCPPMNACLEGKAKAGQFLLAAC